VREASENASWILYRVLHDHHQTGMVADADDCLSVVDNNSTAVAAKKGRGGAGDGLLLRRLQQEIERKSGMSSSSDFHLITNRNRH
jgi:hypothetical protein